MSKSVFVLSRSMSCELLVDEFMFVIASKLFPSECDLFCNDGFVRFANLANWISSKFSTTRRKIVSPEEKKKKHFDHLLTILDILRTLEKKKNMAIGHICICKTAGNFHAS